MRKTLFVLAIFACLMGCSGGDDPTVKGETVSTVPKMSPAQAAQAGALLPGNKQTGGQ